MISVYDAYNIVKKTLKENEVIAGIGESDRYYMFDVRDKNGGDMAVFDIPCVSKQGELFSIDFFDWCEDVDKGKTRVVNLTTVEKGL